MSGHGQRQGTTLLTRLHRMVALPAAALLLLAGACDLDVTNPGQITEGGLEDPEAADVILVGLVADLEDALDAMAMHSGLASDELAFSGTRSWLDFFAKGDIRPSDTGTNWDDAATARWSAERGVERLEGFFGANDALVGQAHVWAGFILRAMGDMYCQAVFDGGPAEPNARYYERAIEHFEAALSADVDSEFRTAANAGLAQAHLILGNYDQAATFAANVPDGDFTFVAHYSDVAGETNLIWSESHQQSQITVAGTPVAELDADPRVPWVDTGDLGAGGQAPFYQQLKYDERGSDIPLAKGWEMRLIEAEVLLRDDDVDGAMEKINEVRTAHGVSTKSAAGPDEAWQALDEERLVTLWLEGRRLRDNWRFLEEGRDDFLEGRSTCFVLSDSEVNSNPNLGG